MQVRIGKRGPFQVFGDFKRDSDTENAPLAQKLLELPYIAEVNITGPVVTLTGDNVESWPAVGKEI